MNKSKSLLSLDAWQAEVLQSAGNIVLRSGRQVGKSTVIAVKAGEFIANNKDKSVLIVAATERQAGFLFEKTLNYLEENYKKLIKGGKDRPTKHLIQLINGSKLYCLPTGMTGYGIRGLTIHMLIADEAAFIPEAVWGAITPMLATTGGIIILLSTPFGKQGYFYRCFENKKFTAFHVSSEDCARIDKDFLAEEKKRMSAKEYAQEYLGEFVDDFTQFFQDEIIERAFTWEDAQQTIEDKFLGVDVARMGKDDTVLFPLGMTRSKAMYQIEPERIIKKMRLTEVADEIVTEDKRKNFRKIYIDDNGIGAGVFDLLLDNEQTKRKVIGLNNASKSISKRAEQKKKLLKEDLYNNALAMMENGKLKLLRSDETRQSLRSVQAEYLEGKMRFFGRYTHIAEAIVRAAWANKEKSLNIWIAWS